MSHELKIERRKNFDGTPCVAPFINGWNVWDIPETEWTSAVEKAILHAYELGWRHCNDQHSSTENVFFRTDVRFEGDHL